MLNKYDIVVIGAGPAGTSFVYECRDSGLSILLLDKAIFPRDKICGDALSADVVNQFFYMSNSLPDEFFKMPEKHPSNGVRFVAPNRRKLDLAYTNTRHKEVEAAGYIAKRKDFDNFLLQRISGLKNVTISLGTTVKEIRKEKNDNVITLDSGKTIKAKMVLGADGAYSIVEKSFTENKIDKNHYAAGVRCYYKNVTGFKEDGSIELHFYKELLPGYLWVFPLPDNQANVGLGILSSKVKGRNLKKMLPEIIEKIPELKERFKEAKPLETVKGHGLPLGSKKKSLSGDGFLLLGDAAGLIDPFTGEGIGNALRSGRFGAKHVMECFRQNRFDGSFNKAYDKLIYQKLWKEMQLSRSIQVLTKYPKIFNYVVNKANKSTSVAKLLTSMLDNIDIKKELVKPSFYFKLFFN